VSWFAWQILGLTVLAGAIVMCCPILIHATVSRSLILVINIEDVWQALVSLENWKSSMAAG
jgi:hypothetical protein